VLAVYWGLWPTAALVCAVVFFGSLYHISNEKRFFWADHISALLLIALNFFLCYLGSFRPPYFWIAVLFSLLSFAYHFYLQERGEYNVNHGLWHMYGSLITLFCIFTLVLR
jgi:ABC-type iron transport system FetAB permease component